MQNDLKVSFIGAGRMATALATGMASSFVEADRIVASDPFEASRTAFAEASGCSAIESNDVAVANADVVVLAVKPQYLDEAAAQISDNIFSDKLVVSVIAGVKLKRLHQLFGEATRIVRVMPNTPALIGAGVSAIAGSSTVGDIDLRLVEQMMQTVGEVVFLPETQIDAVTGLSGSGPAYVYQFIEAMSDGGVLAGLPRQTATKLAAQTVLGAARMVMETGMHPGELKDAVASPAGTTIAGLHELEKGRLRGTVMNAVSAATERSIELGAMDD
ncbi:MAG: pyrroline-5-carboxylate reductase [Planctomycetaceae bacterium]